MCYMGTQLLPKKGHSSPPQFSAHVCFGEAAAWIKMSLATEVDLGHRVTTHCYMGTQIPLREAQ